MFVVSGSVEILDNIFWRTWLGLLCVPGIGTARIRKLVAWLEQHGSTLETWSRYPQKITKATYSVITYEEVQRYQDELRLLPERVAHWHSRGISCVSETNTLYPALLLQIEDRPGLLFVEGTPKTSDRTIGIVGTRNMTAYGKVVTELLTEQVVAYGYTVVSGWMRGVDITAHKICSRLQAPNWGFLGYGHLFTFPAQLQAYRKDFLANGGVLWSEYLPFTPPRAGFFPARNRLIAGSSLGIVVSEAGEKSGSHITVQCGLEYGRAIMAVPGPITSMYSAGTSWLINQGATMVRSGREIHEVVTPQGYITSTPPIAEKQVVRERRLTPLEQNVLAAVLAGPATTEQLAENLNIPPVALLEILGCLELNSHVTKQGQNWYGG